LASFRPPLSPKADDRHHSPKLKNPRSAWLKLFFKGSNPSRRYIISVNALNVEQMSGFAQSGFYFVLKPIFFGAKTQGEFYDSRPRIIP
jgi:hypothetical protein